MILLLACTTTQALSLEAPHELFVQAGEEVLLEARVQGAETVLWHTGDGGLLEGPTVEHRYEGGHFNAFVVATSAEGEELSQPVRVTATWPALDPAPRTSGSLVVFGDALAAIVRDSSELFLVRDGEVEKVPVCEDPRSLSVDGDRLIVACGDLLVAVDADGGREERTLPWGTGARAALSLDLHTESARDEGVQALLGDELWTSRWRSPDGVAVVWKGDQVLTLDPDLGPDSDVDARGVPSYLGAAAVRPDGRAIAFGGLKANTQRGLYNEGRAFTFDTITRAKLVHLDTATGDRLPEPLFDNRDRVGALAYNPRGDLLAVAHFGTGVVDLLDAFTMVPLGGIAHVGLGLEGMVWHEGLLIVLASLDRQLIAYEVQDGLATERWRVDLPAPELHPGQRVFYDASDPRMSEGGYMSCGSCHLDGSTDRLTWDFTDRGEGLRNTSSMLGRAGAVPLHWSANFDEIQDFEKNIRESQGGSGFLDDQDWLATQDPLGAPKAGLSVEFDALADWLGQQDEYPRSPWREADGSLPDAALRGEQAFLEAGCDSCHSGPDFSDSAFVDGEPVLHDVDTLSEGSGARLGEPLTGLDTPTLRGVHDTAPYLHDGSAVTLRQAVVRMPGAEELSDDEVEDLVLYLLCLE